MQPVPAVLLFPVLWLFLREAPARLLLLRAVWQLPVRAAPVRWSVPYPVPFGFLQNARLWYQSALRRCCGLFHVARLCAMHHISEEEAENMMSKADKKRSEYYN